MSSPIRYSVDGRWAFKAPPNISNDQRFTPPPSSPSTVVCETASPLPPPARMMALTSENRRDLAALASSASLGKMPKPPPGYKQNRTKGFPLPDLDTLFGHVLSALGPEIATAKNQAPPEGSGANGGGSGSVGSKRARDPAADEGGGKRRPGDDANGGVKSGGAPSEQGRSPMEVENAGGKDYSKAKKSKPGAAASSEAEPESRPPSDPVQEGLEVSKKAFSRVLGVWEGVAMEGKRGLHQRVVARLGRILAEAEAAALAQEFKASESEVGSLGTVRFTGLPRKRVFVAVIVYLRSRSGLFSSAASRAAFPWSCYALCRGKPQLQRVRMYRRVCPAWRSSSICTLRVDTLLASQGESCSADISNFAAPLRAATGHICSSSGPTAG